MFYFSLNQADNKSEIPNHTKSKVSNKGAPVKKMSNSLQIIMLTTSHHHIYPDVHSHPSSDWWM